MPDPKKTKERSQAEEATEMVETKGTKDSKDQQKLAVTLPGTVEKVIPANTIAPEKAQIAVEGADHLYREIRVDNTLEDEDGKKVGLKQGAHVDVKIEADKEGTVPKK